MAGRKEFELLFKLQAALGSGFNSSFSGAINTTKQLQNTLTKINSLTGKIDGYKRQSEAVENSRKKLALLTEEHEKLQREMSQTETPSDSLKKKFERNEKQIAATTDKITEQEQKLDSLGRELKDAGIDTENLGAANDKLSKSYDRVKKSQEQLAKIGEAQAKNAAAISATKRQLTTTVGVIGAVGAAIYAGPVKSAMAFESKMADVVKVVDGLKDGTTGELTQEYYKLKKEIIDLSTKIPMTADGLTEIAAAAGQAGIARAEIAKFAEDAAKMGIAFDTTADQAGEWMAKWRTSFGLTQKEVVTLADKINYLGNTSAANALQISAIVTKVGPLGEVAGLANGEIAALGATLVSVGVSEDVAATGIKKVMTTMTAGTAATKRQKVVLDKLGISATSLAERMQTDATGAILDFMGAIRRLPAAEQAAALKNYFGEESVAAIAPMLTQLGLLEENFNKVGDATKYAESMEAEYAARADTTENKVQLAKNSLSKLSVVLGETFLPLVGQSAEKLSELVTKLADFAAENPELVKTVVKVATGLAGLSVAGLTAKLGFLELKKGVQGVEKVFAIFKGKTAEAGVAAATNSGKLATLGKSVSGYFGGVKNSLGGLGGSIDKVFGGKLGTVFSKVGNGISGSILKPLGSIGNKIGGVMGGVGGKITGAFGGVFGKIGGAIVNGPMGKIGGVFKSLGGVAGSVLGPAVNGLGGAFSGLFGKVMPIIAIISLLSMLFVKLSGGDISGFIEPLKQAFEQMKPVLQSVMQQFSEMGKQILPLLMDAAKQLAPLFGQIVTAILPVILQLIQQLVPLFIQIVQTVLPVILDLLTQLAPLFTNIITAILPVIVQLMQMLLPIITQLITSVLPIVVQLLSTIVPIISQIINAILPVLLTLLQALMPVIQFVADLFSNVLGAAIQMISGIIGGLMQVLQGIIDFITGVFTGNWTQAWEGIKGIFSGIWESIKSICCGVINGITSAINVVIGGINKLKIPDWVPLVGGKGINIPLIPQLAKGSNFTPDTFIAGEKGAELVTNARGRKVFTAAQTGSIFGNIAQAVNAVRSGTNMPGLQLAYAGAAAGGISAPSVHAAQGGASVVIHSAPVFHVGSDAEAQDIEEALRKRDEELLNEVDERIRKKEDDERRGKYD